MLALSTGNMIGLGTMGAVFIAFAIIASFVVPRSRPDFPGRRGLPFFVIGTVVLFAGMLAAVVVFGAEGEEAGAHGGPAAHAEPAEEDESAEAPGGVTTSAQPAERIDVVGKEFAFELPRSELPAGSYTFHLVNEGSAEHNLVVSGPEVDDVSTDVIGPGETSDVTVALVPGTYKIYCSVPGHEDAGMVEEIEVVAP
jgi:plastocyanin